MEEELKKKNWPVWLKFAVIFGVIGLILGILGMGCIFVAKEQWHTPTAPVIVCIIPILPGFILFSLLEKIGVDINLNFWTGGFIWVLINIILFFLIGGGIGCIVSKNKSRKQNK